MKSSNVFVLGSLLLTLASCGGNKSSGNNDKRAEVNSVCAGIECLSSVDWKIQLPGQNFPDKTRIVVDGTTVINECIPKQKYYIDRYSNPQHITLDSYYTPTKNTVKIEVYDLGHCDSETKIISNDNVSFELNKIDKQITINL